MNDRGHREVPDDRSLSPYALPARVSFVSRTGHLGAHVADQDRVLRPAAGAPAGDASLDDLLVFMDV